MTYALQHATEKDDVEDAGHGFVDVFTANGPLRRRLSRPGR